MSFINWGNESPEQLRLRRRLEEEALFEQARFSQISAAMSAGSGKAQPQYGVYYLRSTEGEPWDEPNNTDEMNYVFGQDNWGSAFFETINLNTVFSANTSYVFIDGGDIGDQAFFTFLDENHTQIQDWVEAGGRLFLNCAANDAPNGSYNLYLGGAMLVWDGDEPGTFNDTANIAEGADTHPIFVGPGDPGTSWTGGSFSHALLLVEATDLIVGGDVPGTICSESTIGLGKVIFGTMTTTNFHDPQPEAKYLRMNIHAYLGETTYVPNLMASPMTIANETDETSSHSSRNN